MGVSHITHVRIAPSFPLERTRPETSPFRGSHSHAPGKGGEEMCVPSRAVVNPMQLGRVSNSTIGTTAELNQTSLTSPVLLLVCPRLRTTAATHTLCFEGYIHAGRRVVRRGARTFFCRS